MRWVGLALIFIFTVQSVGCGKKGPPRKSTYKVTGKVTVDGQPPGSAIQIGCFDIGGMDPNMPTLSQCETKEDGSFEIATYAQGDGVPVGEYKLTFVWQEFSLLSRGYGGPDKLKKKYSDPTKSEITFKVVDKPVVLDPIDLKTK